MSWIFKVRDIANKTIISVTGETTVRDAAKLMVEKNIGGLVVTDKGSPVGIVTERDILKKITAAGSDPDCVQTKTIMSSPLVTVDADATVEDAAELMMRQKIRRLLVTEAGKIAGVFTMRDMVNANRTCSFCHERIPVAILSQPGERGVEGFIECTCGARYHTHCANQAVNCLNCTATLVSEVIYPRPEDTMGG
ncbi:MAG: cyclic nucleotide-binding/CBS domain-containing protein [Candidatus Bathyarchaeia archaeon]